MRILVYGAGVQGCQLAHSLAQNKKNVVTLLARGEWKEVIDQKGLTIRHMLQRKTTVDRMQTTDVLAPEDVYDLVFVTVQAGQLADVLPILRQTGASTSSLWAMIPMRRRCCRPCSARWIKSPLASRTMRAAGSMTGWSVCTWGWE